MSYGVAPRYMPQFFDPGDGEGPEGWFDCYFGPLDYVGAARAARHYSDSFLTRIMYVPVADRKNQTA